MSLVEKIRNSYNDNIKGLSNNMNKDLSFSTYIEYYLTDSKKYNFDLDVFLPEFGINLQRPFVWNLQQQQEFIISLILERYIPNFTIIDNRKDWYEKNSYFEMIDGKQRFTTIVNFMKNQFPIIFEDKEYYFDDLKEVNGNGFVRSSILGRLKANIYYSYPDAVITDRQKIALFKIINFTGVAQEKEHLDNLNKLIVK
jgi:hypothetical protein